MAGCGIRCGRKVGRWHGCPPSAGLASVYTRLGGQREKTRRRQGPNYRKRTRNQCEEKVFFRADQAVCACATHLLDRIWTILKEDRPYELRDVDGTPVTVEQARALIAERYTVPRQVRQRNNQRTRRERVER